MLPFLFCYGVVASSAASAALYEATVHRSEFIKAVKEQFPELRDPINQQEGLLCFELREFRLFTERAIRDGDTQKLAACYRLVETAYLTGNRKFKDAIDVCFIEDMDYNTHGEIYKWAWDMLPEVLKALYVDFHGPIVKDKRKRPNIANGARFHKTG